MKRKTNSPTHGQRPEPVAQPEPGEFSSPPARPAPRWRFRLALVLAPCLLLAVLELGLRLAGYGYDPSFFKSITVGKGQYLVENDKFGLSFFPPGLARSPAPLRMKAYKDSGTCRVFLLGESAALGDPRPAYGPGRYLQTLLQERFPGTKFEVICVAMTAINSHAILPIARECARHEGDLWLIYMGNNEMVGPFGAATVFGPRAPSRGFVRLSLAVQRTRLGQLLVSWGRKLKGRGTREPAWAGMEMFLNHQVAPGDPAKETVYENFRGNLRAILDAGYDAGVPVLLSTVAVNLRDCPPFASESASPPGSPELQAAMQLCRDGTAAAVQTNFTRAAECFSQASTVEPQRADIQFQLAECMLLLTNVPGAHEHFELARDLDALPFRADSRINHILDSTGKEYSDRGVRLLDSAAVLAKDSLVGLPGREFFYEHVHLNFDGNYRLARAWAEQLGPMLPQPVRQSATAGWASQEVCEQNLGLTDYNRFGVLDDMLRRLEQPPFTGQFNQTQRLEHLRAERQALRGRMNPTAAAEARKVYLAALERAPEDFRLHENYAEYLEFMGELEPAAQEWAKMQELIPQHHLAYYEIGHLELRQGKLAAARRWLTAAVGLRPDLSEGWLELGQADALDGKPGLALTNYERARALLPQDPRAYYHIGRALSKLGRQPEAIAQLQKAVQLRPAYWEAHSALGEELAFSGKVREAEDQFVEVIRLRPDYAMGHLNLGVALFKRGEVDQAVKEFQEARRLDPSNKLADEYLQKLAKPTPGDAKNK